MPTAVQISPFGAARTVILAGLPAAHSGYRVSHDCGAITVGNEAPVWPSAAPTVQPAALAAVPPLALVFTARLTVSGRR